ncbi:Uma2 family endonuclease [Streptomyces sp. RLB3-17]|uniref:Uma2 family endonuclease n=1 Tax=unclassified Streptomyces TaxID=2593676 RepID=UPI001163A50C|nr:MULTISPECIES: Uma2 family endonuclease [unclassified Streptomyces]QDN99704.1 Uma2 family endonuclease [Streptomyces sp. RLB1-9]QDO21436.1 Uma2 family endonuclease [Streptomyces sp. S1A1-8]QDO31560.1 Uma2 family endonuclease [Streptomyces sp. S1A1-3]QDO41497.1 Uma2 family endonuclease [Streptomyces sp. RLB3-17]
MTALAHERPETMSEVRTESENDSDFDEVLWQAWKAMELPEGYRAEIIEGAIEVSPTARRSHGLITNRVRRALDKFLDGGEYACHQGVNVIHRRKAWIPDAFVAPEDTQPWGDEDDLGVRAEAVYPIVEVVSPGKRNQDRDRVRKLREYARAGIPTYVGIDDYDAQGSVTLCTGPRPDKADWEDIHRVYYGTDVTIPEGPAKGFVIGETITGPKRS